ncbi:hypothetical protein CRYUN_Cryun39dG0060800 [Craigia yunnanensis]
MERGTSLQEFLLPKNVEKLFDVNVLKRKPFQASQHYKNIIRRLVIAGKSLIEEELICGFNLNNIFVVEKDDDVYVEVTDFAYGQDYQLWNNLYDCLVDINSKLADYNVNDDTEMTEVLKFLRDGDRSNTLLKSTFFWDWRMKKEFICKIRQLFEIKDYFWIKKCESSFDNQWITEIKKDRELEKLLLQYQLSLEGKQEKKSSQLSHSNNRQSAIETGPQLHPVSFIGSLFRHFYVNKKKIEKNAMRLNIRSEEDLQRRLECCLGHYTQSLVSKVIHLKELPRDELVWNFLNLGAELPATNLLTTAQPIDQQSTSQQEEELSSILTTAQPIDQQSISQQEEELSSLTLVTTDNPKSANQTRPRQNKKHYQA